ncbi:hypothetical protein Bpfe_027198, partial [Biomphalaria pfeifferi]
SLPRSSEGDIRKAVRSQGKKYLQKGSSLDLAPSLLNIYDDIAASGGRLPEKEDSEEEDFQEETFQKVVKTQSLPFKTNGQWSSEGVRPGILPSLSEPGDRPVSCLVSNWAPSNQHADSKKRPLSLSSMSSASSSSLPRLRKKRTNGKAGQLDVLDGSQISEHSHVESRSSVDSGCMEGDKHGDDVSLMSDQNSWRDDLDSSSASLHSASPETSSMTSQEKTTTSSNSSISHSPSNVSFKSQNSRTWTPRNKKIETSSDLRNSNKSTTSLVENVDIPSPSASDSPSSSCATPTNSGSYTSTPVTTPESGHRRTRPSRQEARKRFFSNYEEHMRNAMSDLEPAVLASSQPQSTASPSETLLVHDKVPSKPSLPLQAEIQDERRTPPQLTRKGEGHGDRESPSHITRRSEGRGGSRKERHGSPKTNFTKSIKRKEAGSNRDSSEVSGTGYITYVQRVVTEIIESERIYISSLKDIIQGYLEPFEKILSSKDDVKDVECLFGNIREIYTFGCAFLTDLEATGADPVKVAECFVKHNKGFVIYADYCTNYPRAVDILTKFMKHPERSELCKERQLMLGHGLPLGAYLLRPVQRILKYHLLLQNIVKNYEKEGKEMDILQQAFHHMTEMAHHINEMKRRHEHAVRIQEIQSQLEDYVGEDLTRLGELVLESTFRVYGAKASRQVFLFERGLLISKKTDGGMLSCKTFILCSNLMLVEVIPNEPLSFHIIPFDNPRAQYTLQARNMEQKRRWCQEIKRLILESFKGKIPDSVKSLVMQLGSNHDDDYITKEALEAVRKTQHTAPEYLEKRRFRRKSGSRLPDFSLLKPQRAKRGANKKSENKGAETGRRAESKSPDAYRRLLVPQNAIKRRSQSHSVLVPSPATSHMLNTSADNAVPTPESPSTDFSIDPSRAHDFTSGSNGTSSKKTKTQKLIETEKEAELVKRAQSFRKAMQSHPITSADLTELVARCGGSVHLTSPDNSPSKNNNSAVSFIDSPETSLLGLRSIDSSSDEDIVDSEKQMTTEEQMETNSQGNNASDLVVNEEANLEINGLSTKDSQSFTLTDSQNVNVIDENGTCHVEDLGSKKKTKNSSQSDDITTLTRAKGRLSRRDQPMVKKRNKENDTNEDVPSRRVMAFHDSYSKRVAEKAILRNKGLRLPNTSKHLSVPDCEPHGSAKLTNWNSIEKLTAGSMSDVTHLNEDPWVMNTDMTSSESSVDMAGSNGSTSFSNSTLSNVPHPAVETSARPRGHSDLTEMMHVAFNRDNMDWLVYLNRNSLSSNTDINKSWLPGSNQDKEMRSQEALTRQNNVINHFPYATPPRSYMTTENMKKHNYLTETNQNSYQRKSGVNAFGGTPQTITLTKPIVFQVPSLTRSNSTPLATTRISKVVSDRRPYSMDVDRLTDESNRMVAEMEEYISNSAEEIKGTNKFPTSLAAITVEEDANNNRLSVASSLSASSYESQDSSSSDGMMGTLKHKLHFWATNHPGARCDSEQSHSSTVTSEDEDNHDDTRPLTSGNTFDPPSRSRTSWRESRDLENVLREHSLGSSSLGSRMAHALPLTETVMTSNNNMDEVDSRDVLSPIYLSTMPAGASSSSSLTTDATESCSNLDLQPSSSAISLQSNETGSSVTVTFPPHNDYIPEPVLELSDSSKEATPKTKPRMNKSQTNEENSNLKSASSLESLGSNDSFYERRFSVALDSEVFVDKPTVVKVYDDTQTGLPRKSIKEYVQHIEQKFKQQSPKILEVRRKEPGAMIRQRLETLRENVLHSRRGSSSRHTSEERESSRAKSQPPSQHRNKLPTGPKPDTRWNDDIRIYDLKTSTSRDSLSKSMENISRSKENMTRSKSKDLLSFRCDSPGHEKDASRFIYMNYNPSSNQFIHKAQSSELHETEVDNSMSQSMCRLDQLSSELDNLVIMKGYVKALISRFQEK